MTFFTIKDICLYKMVHISALKIDLQAQINETPGSQILSSFFIYSRLMMSLKGRNM
jgi:hypothetical protein